MSAASGRAAPYDVAVVGGGPAGATCAAFCAAAGLKTVVLERAKFPREKVCGDCLNPACWPIFERLGIAERLLALPHSRLAGVEFSGIDREPSRFALPVEGRGEIAIRRSLLDQLLLQRATDLGAEVVTSAPVTALERGWRVQTSRGEFSARVLVAADGRNSTVARLLKLFPETPRERAAIQTHVASPADFSGRVALRLRPQGYCGVAPVGDALNVCLVSRPGDLPELKRWAVREFEIPSDQQWRTVTPLARRAIAPWHGALLLAGDAARVVEPFTGEGIFYALASGELAARHIVAGDLASYAIAHGSLYRGRLWINQLSRLAVLHPRAATRILDFARTAPAALRFLTSKVVGSAVWSLTTTAPASARK